MSAGKERARQSKPAALRCEASYNSEHKLAAELQGTWTVITGDFSKVTVMVVDVNALRVNVVECVEGLKAKVDVRTLGCDRNGLEQRDIPVLDSGTHGRIFARVAKSLVRAAIPRSNWIGIRFCAEPLRKCLGIFDR